MEKSDHNKFATFGGGCFWCVEALFQRIKGVKDVVSGYAGGKIPNPTYQKLKQGESDHAEVIQMKYNEKEISFEGLCNIFFQVHDPTTLNQQGPDKGIQYRSVILYHDKEQRQTAEKVIKEVQHKFKDPIVTFVQPFEKFYTAEEYHQNFYNENLSHEESE